MTKPVVVRVIDGPDAGRWDPVTEPLKVTVDEKDSAVVYLSYWAVLNGDRQLMIAWLRRALHELEDQ
jgi:hypothetical protein